MGTPQMLFDLDYSISYFHSIYKISVIGNLITNYYSETQSRREKKRQLLTGIKCKLG